MRMTDYEKEQLLKIFEQASNMINEGKFDEFLSAIAVSTAYTDHTMGLIGQTLLESDIDILHKIKKLPQNFLLSDYDLTSIVIPDNITAIHSFAFQNCTSLRFISLPRSLTYLGMDIFGHCRDVKIQYEGTKDEWDNLVDESARKWNHDCTYKLICSDYTSDWIDTRSK